MAGSNGREAATDGPNAQDELTYPLGATAKLTGITADTLRAWERRYGIVVPLRTPGGTRRYRASDLERLRLVKAAVDAGHRVGELARLDAEQLEIAAAAQSESIEPDVIDAIMAALEKLDGAETERLIALQLAALGPARFATSVAAPLLDRIGEAWAEGRLSAAAEHLATSVLRSLLGASLRPTSSHGHAGKPLVLATLSGERHEMGLLIAAITAAAAGGEVVYLGPDLPVEELASAVRKTNAAALVLSLVSQDEEPLRTELERLREEVPPGVEVWVGGSRAPVGADVEGVTALDSFDQLEQRVRLLTLGRGRPGV